MAKSFKGDRLSPNDVVRTALSMDVPSSGTGEEPEVTKVLHILDVRGTDREVRFLSHVPRGAILGEE